MWHSKKSMQPFSKRQRNNNISTSSNRITQVCEWINHMCNVYTFRGDKHQLLQLGVAFQRCALLYTNMCIRKQTHLMCGDIFTKIMKYTFLVQAILINYSTIWMSCAWVCVVCYEAENDKTNVDLGETRDMWKEGAILCVKNIGCHCCNILFMCCIMFSLHLLSPSLFACILGWISFNFIQNW